MASLHPYRPPPMNGRSYYPPSILFSGPRVAASRPNRPGGLGIFRLVAVLVIFPIYFS